MSDDLEQKLARLREQLERGEYTVDPDAVAQALLQRLRLRAIRAQISRVTRIWPLLVQNECSNPETETGDPSSATIDALAFADPADPRDRPRAVTGGAASSIAVQAAAGAQMHSS